MDGDHIQPFVTLASSPQAANPRVVADIIQNATSSPKLFSFGELLSLEPVRALRDSEEYAAYLRILELFAWGTCGDYSASSSTLPALSNAQTEKLRILTILSLAHNHPPPLSYSTALAALHLPSDQIPVLEALVTKAIYSDLLTARLSPTTNTENGVGCVYITSVKPVRDVPLSNVPMMETVLSEARNRCARAIADVEAEAARVIDIAQTRASQEHEKKKKLDRLYDKEASLMAARAATAAADRRPDSRRSLHAREDWGRDIAGVMPQILPAYATRLPGMDEVKLDELR